MADFPIRIPKVSMAASEAGFSEVLIPDGGAVDEGDPLYVIETDKVEQEIESPAGGIVHWTAETQQMYDVGTQIGYIELDP